MLQPRIIKPSIQRALQLTRKPEIMKPGNTENRKCGNPDHPEIEKSEIKQKRKPIPRKRR